MQAILATLFETYPLYDDRESRRAVEAVLKSLTNGPHGELVLPAIVKFLKEECQKKGIAHLNAFVLVDWCSVLLLQFAKQPERWSKFGLDLALADARVLETCLGAGSDRRGTRISHSALVVTRRALRAILGSKEIGQDALDKLVANLTAKGVSPTAANAVFLGVVAGVSSRLSDVKPRFEQHKQEYYAFYVREIVGSRSQLPDHISNALYDFFDAYPTLDELRKEVIPPIEKALLRAPEVVLNDIVSPMILALPESLDLSDVLLGNLLKPLLSNVKSSNSAIRAGALRTFTALASRSQNEDVIGKVADEVLNPLKQGKVSGVDQKVLHAQMLSAFKESPALSQKIPIGIAPVALKEPGEPAVVAEVSAMTKHLTYGLANGGTLDKVVTDAFIKGMADKRIPVRRLWAIRAADIWWNLTDAQHAQADILSFCQSTLPKLVEIWQEVNANPLPATQSGLVTVGHYVTALLLKIRDTKDDKLAAVYKKSDVLSQSLVSQPKPSFLLNTKVYTKLSTEDDIVIALRALRAVAPFAVDDSVSEDIQDAWAQAFMFFVAAQSVSSRAKSAAKLALTQTYLEVSTRKISEIIIQGAWSWYKSSIQEDKESAAFASKNGAAELGAVLGCICLPPDIVKKLEGNVTQDQLRKQAISLLVLARGELVPKTSWIDVCLRMGVDPGQLVQERLQECMGLVNEATEVRSPPSLHYPWSLIPSQNKDNDQFPSISLAAYSAYTDLAFVAPKTALPVIVKQFSQDLDPKQLESIGPQEAAIFRTPEGTAYVDVLSKKAPVTIDKNTKDYDTLKWEEELRAQLAQKQGKAKKLTSEEQAKVNAQLAKESAIRKEVTSTEQKMRRGVGIIQSLATGPPTEAEQWMGPAVDLLIHSIRAGVGLLLGDLPATTFIACSQRVSNRLGPIRPFVGVATLRTIGSIHLPEEYEGEQLGGKSTIPVDLSYC